MQSWRTFWLNRVVALFGLALVGATWRLWTPQTVFPQVPWFAELDSVPTIWQWIGLATMVGSLLLLLAAGARRWLQRAASLIFIAATAGMILLDQERFQPWAYQLVLTAVVLAACRDKLTFRLLRALTISLYIYSALSKLDYTFLHELGQQFLKALMGCLGVAIERWPVNVRLAGASLFPTVELAIGVGLFFNVSRRLALIASIAQHLALLVVLGPWGLNHQAGVLIWNCYFIVQNVLLFGGRAAEPLADTAETATRSARSARRSPFSWLAVTAIVAAMLLPLLEFGGWIDQWPAWALYASRGEQLAVFVSRTAANRLPEEVRRNLQPAAAGGDEENDEPLQRLWIDRWALDALHAPIYPQNRFRLAVVEFLARRYRLDNEIQVNVSASADRWTGEREQTTLIGEQEIVEVADAYRLNAHARPTAK